MTAIVKAVRVTLESHPKNETLLIAKFDGGQVVLPSGKVQEGDLAVFISAGAKLPGWLAETLITPDVVTAGKVEGVKSDGILYPAAGQVEDTAIFATPIDKFGTNAINLAATSRFVRLKEGEEAWDGLGIDIGAVAEQPAEVPAAE